MFNHKKALREIEFLSEQEAKIYTWNSMELVVPPTVYPPREDTNLLHDIVADIAPFGAKKLLEIGCGSGAISIAAAKIGWSVDACDINPYAVAATRNNATRHNVVLQVSESGLGPQDEQIPEFGWHHDLYDVVLWNMPYIPHSEVNENLLGPLEEASLIDTHPTGLLEVFARLMSSGKLCTWNGIALLVCREVVHWKRSVDVLRQQGLAARIVRTLTFEDRESIHVIAAWHPFITGKHHKFKEIDSTNAELLRGAYASGDSLVTLVQTQGRGRHGNAWQDHPGSFKASWLLDQSHLMSTTPYVQLEMAQQIRNALCLKRDQTNLILTKWPNDLLLRSSVHEKWRKFGGVLFQSFSRGDEQRIVVGIGINTSMKGLQKGQGSLEEIGIQSRHSDLFAVLSAVVASMFEHKHDALKRIGNGSIANEYLLRDCFYRAKTCTLQKVGERDIELLSDGEETYRVGDDEEIIWTNLHPQ